MDPTTTAETDTLARVLELCRRHLRINGPEPDVSPTPDARLADDLGLDALDLVELIMTVEERLNCEIHDDRIDDLVTVADLARAADEGRRGR